MVDQVTFPPSIGGSGKTYTNDANPQTGMFNGGHRINFFPVMSDMVAAAGYVSRYAQAIDGAKANADKAEDAKGYVEAVADAYNVNIIEGHASRAALELDFYRNHYRIDAGGSTAVSNDVSQLSGYTFARTTAKTTINADGRATQKPAQTLARSWKNSVARGALFEPSGTNLLLRSVDFSTGWSGAGRVTASDSGEVSPIQGVNWITLTETETTLTEYYYDTSFSISEGLTYTFSCYVADSGERDVAIRLPLGFGTGNRAVLDLSSGQIKEGAAYSSVERVYGGWRLTVTMTALETRSGIFRIQFIKKGSTTGVFVGEGKSLKVAAPQAEVGRYASSPVLTTSSPVTRTQDQTLSVNAAEVAGETFTLYFEGFVSRWQQASGTVLGLCSLIDDQGTFFSLCKFSQNFGLNFLVRDASNQNLFSAFLGEASSQSVCKLAVSFNLRSGNVVIARDGAVRGEVNVFSYGLPRFNSLTINDRVTGGDVARTGMEFSCGRVLIIPDALTSTELAEVTKS